MQQRDVQASEVRKRAQTHPKVRRRNFQVALYAAIEPARPDAESTSHNANVVLQLTEVRRGIKDIAIAGAALQLAGQDEGAGAADDKFRAAATSGRKARSASRSTVMSSWSGIYIV